MTAKQAVRRNSAAVLVGSAASDEAARQSEFAGQIEEDDFRGFVYKGYDANGKSVKSIAPYKTEIEARKHLRAAGITVESITPRNPMFAFLDYRKNFNPGVLEMAALADQISAQFATGLTYDKICRILGKTHPKVKMKRALLTAANQITDGTPAWQAFAEYKKDNGDPFFPPAFIHAFYLGEKIGAMEDPETGESDVVPVIMLRFFARSMRKASEMFKAMVSGLIGPAGILGFSIFVFFIQVYFIVPQFAQIFEGLLAGGDTSLPLPTQIMIDISDFLYSLPGLIFALAFFGGLGWSIYYFFFNKDGIEKRGRLEVRLPIFKNFFVPYYGSIFFRSLCIMFAHPELATRFRTVGETTTNPDFKEFAFHCETVVIGDAPNFSEMFSGHIHLTGETFPMIAETIDANPGKAQQLIFTHAKYLEMEADEKLKISIALISNAVYFFAAGVVAFILIASYAPLITMVGRLSGGGG